MFRMNLSSEARSSLPELVRLRREIHRHPEMGFQEKLTSALIEKSLRSAGVEAKRLCGTGVVGLVKGAKPGPTLLIRADMDALPVTEENDVSYKSKTPGTMHA